MCEICLALAPPTHAGPVDRPHPAPWPGPPVPPAPSGGFTPVAPGVLLCWLARSLPCVRYKILPAWLLGGENGTKLSLHAQKAPNWAILGERGEFCTGSGAVWLLLGEFCTAHAARAGEQGEFCTGGARRGCCWASNAVLWRSPCASWRAMAVPWRCHGHCSLALRLLVLHASAVVGLCAK